MNLATPERSVLLDVARHAIVEGLDHGHAWLPEQDGYAFSLREPGASFVTLTRAGELRGCRGMLEAVRPLVQDVAHNAYLTAFDDPRFPPVAPLEFADLAIEISVLSALEWLAIGSEAELLARLRPHVDGLVLQDGYERATFLPKVWDKLPEPQEFVTHLKWKAGWPADYWSDTLRVYRYTTETFTQ